MLDEPVAPRPVHGLIGLPREIYRAMRPWKACRVSRLEYEERILSLPSEQLYAFREENHATRLINAIFGCENI